MALQKITSITGRGVYVPGNDIDTDRIIPARFMKCVTFDGLGQYLFYDVRKNSDGTAQSQNQAIEHGRHLPGDLAIFIVGRSILRPRSQAQGAGRVRMPAAR